MEGGEKQLVRDMTYKVEQWVRKIKSPVTVKIGETAISYPNGEELADDSFSEPLVIDSVLAENSKIIIKLVKNSKTNDVNWVGEEQSFF